MRKHFGFQGLPVIAILLLTACVSTNLPPIGSTSRFTPEDDERQLWQAGRQVEDKVLPPTAVYENAPLEQYLTGIAGRVTPPGYAAAGGQSIQVKVRKDPRLNAAAMAHGLIIVHTGLVSRAENESELAGVLAHEVAHITYRHQIRKRRELQNQQTAVNVTALLSTLALTAAAVDQSNRGNFGTAAALSGAGQPLLMLGLNLTYAAMVSGYSRDMEREADQEAIRRMASAGYSPQDMARMFRRMMAESPDRGAIETFFWGSHPRLAERIETVEQEARKYSAADRGTRESFDRQTAVVRLDNAGYDAYVGRWRLATTQVERTLATSPAARREALGAMVYGRLHGIASLGARSRKDEHEAERNYAIAVDRFNFVTSAPNITITDQALGYRGLGDLYFAHRDFKATHCEAKVAYARYLEINPGAKDETAIKERMGQLPCGPRN